MSSFDKQPFYNSTTSESDALQNRREPNNQRQDKTFNPHQSTQKQVKFEDKGNSEPLHVINAVNLRKRPNRERPVIGVAIFNNTLNVEILVTETVSNNDCLLGNQYYDLIYLFTHLVYLKRDLINKLKHIGPRFEHIKTMVKTMSDEVRRIFREEMREKRCKKTIKSCTYHNVKEEEVGSITNFDEVHPENNFGKGEGEVPKPKVCGTVIETEIVAELKETCLSKDDLNMEAVENARAFLKNKIQEVSAKSVLDLKPERNSDVAFEIEFQDPNQKPIKCRYRPLPWNLKKKVSTELDRQLKAGIIRPSRSQWCFPIRNGINYHLDTVMAVLDTLNKRSLKVSFEKSVPVEFEIQLLGNVISK
ncbi:hypothetical protein BpHYR1_005005, partial [Brachionus plicatilis]